MSQDLRDIEPVTGLWMGALFFLMGLFIILVAVDWLQVDPGTIHVPRWVLGVCGGMFALTGLGILYYGIINALGRGRAGHGSADPEFPVVSWILGLVIAGGLAVVASWIALGPGERVFTGSVGIGGVGVGRSVGSETPGRLAFGLGALLCWAFFTWTLISGIRQLAGRTGGDDT